MKYIRTKDRVCVYDKAIQNIKSYWKTTLLSKYKINKYIKADIEILNKAIITQADTIEELCDRFILSGIDIIILNKEHTQYRFEDDNPYLDDYDWFDITETELKRGIYGAIWTDKGLIYVAKMNSKGVLELL